MTMLQNERKPEGKVEEKIPDLARLSFTFVEQSDEPGLNPGFEGESESSSAAEVVRAKLPQPAPFTVIEHQLTVEGHPVKVYERHPAEIIVERPIIYIPGYLEGVGSNETFLQQLDDRIVFAVEVSAGTNRFAAYKAVHEKLNANGLTPDALTHSMGAFMLDHDFTSNNKDIALFNRLLMITPPGFIEGESFVRLLGGFIGEAWQGTFSSRPDFRRADKSKPISEGLRYIRSGIINTLNEALRVSKVDLASNVELLKKEGKEIHAVVTTSDRLIPGDKTKTGLLRGGLSEDDIIVIEGTHVPHLSYPQLMGKIVKEKFVEKKLHELDREDS